MAEGSGSDAEQTGVEFYVTGFGAFHGVADNPTTHLVKSLPQLFDECVDMPGFCSLKACEVVETSGAGALEHLRSIIACAREQNDSCAKKCFVHFGVNGMAREFNLESTAWNGSTLVLSNPKGSIRDFTHDVRRSRLSCPRRARLAASEAMHWPRLSGR
jgi:hypothetical protein